MELFWPLLGIASMGLVPLSLILAAFFAIRKRKETAKTWLIVCIISVGAFFLAVDNSACNHSYKPATCTSPKICIKCGREFEEALGHDWVGDCTEPRVCSRCNKTESIAPGHEWVAATCTEPRMCTRCGETDGTPLGHDWIDATYTEPKTCTRCGVKSGVPLEKTSENE